MSVICGSYRLMPALLGCGQWKRQVNLACMTVSYHYMPRSPWWCKAALVDIAVESEYFTASYGIFLPGLGGWGGERGGTSVPADEETGESWSGRYATAPNQAALYRLTGDLHPIHIDPEVAQANSFERPILHGLCTLGIAARMIAEAAGAHPADLKELEARLSSPVLPGDIIEVTANTISSGLNFEARVGSTLVLKGGRATFC